VNENKLAPNRELFHNISTHSKLNEAQTQPFERIKCGLCQVAADVDFYHGIAGRVGDPGL
jgi:hypothetical protein